MEAKGRVFKYGDNVDTDVIIPARYLNSFDAKELATHAMVDLDPTFVERVQEGDIIVAKKNFGCGSSREHAPLALKTAGVSCVIAKSFARIFYRNSINIGFAILECPEAVDGIDDGDEVKVDYETGNKADGFYALAIAPIIKNKFHVKARYDMYRPSAEWNNSKAYYEIGADYEFVKNLKISAEYILVNDRSLEKHNYSMIDTQLSFRF